MSAVSFNSMRMEILLNTSIKKIVVNIAETYMYFASFQKTSVYKSEVKFYDGGFIMGCCETQRNNTCCSTSCGYEDEIHSTEKRKIVIDLCIWI